MKQRHKITAFHSLMPHYQVYYWTGLAECGPFSMAGGPWWYLLPWPAFALDVESVSEKVRGRFGFHGNWNATDLEQFVGSYRWHNRHDTVSFAIDAHDTKEIVSPKLLDSCDIYFKANKWRGQHYPEKVVPIVNGNGFLRKRHLRHLKKLRKTRKDNDLLFISRVWGGVEHNVRLFEALASLPCSKRLIAILVKGVASDQETAEAKRRLQAAGVVCTSDLLTTKELWRATATSRVVMLRAGKHMCIPWRMIDLLCMGTCIATDAEFEPEWPEPLVAGVHYWSGGIARPGDTSSAQSGDYVTFREKIADLLKQQEVMVRIRKAAADYFDRYASPSKVGEYIMACINDKLMPGNEQKIESRQCRP
jgi:glycosyltransferase involved in cell wall biosynthesis